MSLHQVIEGLKNIIKEATR